MKNYNKLLSIEIPTCNKKNFETNIIGSLKNLQPLANFAKFNINFQKQFTENDLKNYKEIFKSYGFDISCGIFYYNKPRGFNSIIQFREDTHQLDNISPFILSLDDDMKFTNIKYSKVILACILYMLKNNTVGSICVEGFMYGRNIGCSTNEIKKCTKEHKYWTDGGILVRNNRTDKRLFSEECYELLGAHQDWLLVKTRMADNLVSCRVITPFFKHYEFRKTYDNRGYNIHGWNIGDTQNNTISKYMSNLNINYKYLTDIKINTYNFLHSSIEILTKEIDNFNEK